MRLRGFTVPDSTLCFRGLDDIVRSVRDAGLEMVNIRDAPDCPGLEHVVLARRPR